MDIGYDAHMILDVHTQTWFSGIIPDTVSEYPIISGIKLDTHTRISIFFSIWVCVSGKIPKKIGYSGTVSGMIPDTHKKLITNVWL